VTALLKDAWALAIETLTQMDLRKVNERLALTRTARQMRIANSDSVRYAYGLVVETERRKNLIEKLIENVIKPKKLENLNIGVQEFLKLYVYQTRIAKASVEPDLQEAERIAKLARSILGWKTLRVAEPYLGFLLTRPIAAAAEAATDEERIALQTFHPVWFVKYCFALFGRNEAVAFLEGSISSPPVCIRLNTLKASEDEILAKLEAEGVKLEKTETLKHTYRLVESEHPLTSLASHGDGLFYAQDKASCFAAEAAAPEPHMIVLDVCAAPGAKTTYLAQLMQNQGSIYSLDFSARRMKTWRLETQRMGATIAEPVIADACSPIPFVAEVDVAVLDPPCTSTGVFGRQPSAKWRLTLKSIETMAEIQWQMISNVAEKVKSGGVLAYSTCSITVEENEMLVERFMKWHPEFQLAEINPQLGLPGLRGLTKCRRLYPHLHGCNGFFIAKLKKE
jgi:16S rRNA (cytosine967-C5)-methyltransferase